MPKAFSQQAAFWKLAWSDEFNGPAGTAPDAAKWRFQSGPGAQVGGNEEAEFYCAYGSATAPCKANQPNAYLDGNGHLVVVAVKTDGTVQAGPGKAEVPVYTSARLLTVQPFRYGRMEASLRLPVAGNGVWPAFWALGQETATLHWPAVGEIDVMEQWNPQPGAPDRIDAATVHGAVHGPVAPGSGQGFLDQTADYTLAGPASDGFHQYAVDWSPGEVDFYVDGNLYHRTSPATLTGRDVWAQDDGPFTLILNLAMGGGFFGYPDARTSATPTMVVDYVRVYQHESAPLKAGWSNADIGGPAVGGSSTFANGVFTVDGGGSGMSGRSDQFQMAYTPMAGDGEVSAHVLDQTSKVPQAKAGVMLREGRGAAAPFAMMFRSPDGSVHFRFRTARGDVPGEVVYQGAASWLKVIRRADVFTGLASADGKTWTAVGDARLPVRRDLLAGLVSTSRDNRAPDVARFDYVAVTGSDAAFDGEPAAIPGTVQAERFDTGGAGYTYSAALGEAGPEILGMPETVRSSTGAGGYFLRVPAAGSYLNYSVQVAKEGDYAVTLRAASAGSGGTMHFNLDQKPLTKPFALPDTGGATVWREVSAPTVHLPAGQHTLALVIDSAGMAGLDAFTFRMK